MFRTSALVDGALFVLLIGVLSRKAFMAADRVWDTLAYHIPFTSRYMGLTGPDTYTFLAWLELCYQGFPALPYYLYSALWRLTGTPNGLNLLSVIVFAGFCLFVARTLRAPVMIVAAAVAAIPVIYVNLGSAYVDIVVNMAFAGALVTATLILIERDHLLLPRVFAVLAFAAIAANYKLNFIPLVGLFVPLFAGALFVVRAGDRRLLSVLFAQLRQRPIWVSIGFGVLLCACAATAVKNLIVYGNPTWPVAIVAGGHQIFRGEDITHVYVDPKYLRSQPQIVRWLLSVLEYLALGFRPVPYTLGQGEVLPTAPSLRMGGYLSLFVVYNLVIFVWSAWTRGRPTRILAAVFGVGTLIVACLPASHELRYYSFWMIYLVTMNIAFCWRWAQSPFERRHFAAVAIAAAIFVASVTGLSSLRAPPHGTAVADLVTELKLDTIYRPKLVDGGRYCLVNWGPYAILASPLFNPGKTFSVIEVEFQTGCPADAVVMDLPSLQTAAAP